MSELELGQEERFQIPPMPGAEEKDFLVRFNGWYDESKSFKEPIKKMMDHAYTSYRSILSDFSYSQRNVDRWGLAVFVPLTFQVVSSIEAQLNGRPPQYRIGPMNNPSDLEQALFVNKFSKAEFRRAKALRDVASATQQALIFGTSFLRSYYRYDVKKCKFIKEVDEGTGLVKSYEERDKVFYKGWSLTNDHPLKVLLPPVYEHKTENWQYYMVEDVCDYKEIRRYYELHPELRYKDNYKFLQPGGVGDDLMDVYNKHDILYRMPTSRYPGSRKDLVNSLFPGPQSINERRRKNAVSIVHVFNQDTDEWAVVAMCGRGIGMVLEYHPNPIESTKELPVVAMRDYQIANYPWGLGEPDLIRWLQFEANAVHNLGLDSMKYSAVPIFGVNAAMLDDEDEFEVYPGKMVHTKNIPGLTIDSAIKVLSTPDVKNSVFKFMGINEDIIRKTTGTGSSVIGGDASGDGSATEYNAIKSATEARIYDKARRIEQDNLTDVIRHQLSFMAEYYDEEMTVKVTDQEFYKFMPGSGEEYSQDQILSQQDKGFKGVIFGDDLAQGYDVVVEGESTLPMSKTQVRTEAMQLLKLAGEVRRAPTAAELAANPQLPAMYPQGLPVLDSPKIASQLVLPTFSNIDDPEQYLWKYDGQGQDRVRNPGRPEDVYTPDEPVDAAQMSLLADAQPANQGVNAAEAMV